MEFAFYPSSRKYGRRKKGIVFPRKENTPNSPIKFVSHFWLYHMRWKKSIKIQKIYCLPKYHAGKRRINCQPGRGDHRSSVFMQCEHAGDSWIAPTGNSKYFFEIYTFCVILSGGRRERRASAGRSRTFGSESRYGARTSKSAKTLRVERDPLRCFDGLSW